MPSATNILKTLHCLVKFVTNGSKAFSMTDGENQSL